MPVFSCEACCPATCWACAHAGRWQQLRGQRAGDGQGGRRAALGLKGGLRGRWGCVGLPRSVCAAGASARMAVWALPLAGRPAGPEQRVAAGVEAGY